MGWNENELLRLEGVCLSNRDVSCRDISLSLHTGEILVVFGPEKSGAELICPIIIGMEESFEGDVLFKGESIKGLDYLGRLNYRKSLGYLQKNYGLISNMTVEENIALPLKYHSRLSSAEIKSVVDGFIAELNLEHCRSRRPVDLDNAEVLKTAYARAIALEPELLLIEHALEGQCLLNSQVFMASLRKRSASPERSVIIFTYEPERFFDFSTRFVMLYEGAIVFSGTRDDFLAMENDYLQQYMKSSVQGPMRIL